MDLMRVCNLSQISILPLIRQFAQERTDSLEHPAWCPGILPGLRRISAFVNPGFTSPACARAVHQLRRSRLASSGGLASDSRNGRRGAWFLNPAQVHLQGRRREQREVGPLPHQRHEPRGIDPRLRPEL